MTVKNMSEIRDAAHEVEHISGIGETRQRAHERFADLRNEEPFDRIEGFRPAVAATRDEFHDTIERINRWWVPFDRAWGKLVRAVLSGGTKKRT